MKKPATTFDLTTLQTNAHYCQIIIDRMHKLDPTLPITINGKNYEI